jgi:Flp pilus assembly pilin Flp
MGKPIEAFCRGEEATTAIEYAFIAGLIAVAGFVTLVTLGDTIETMYGVVAGGVSNSVSGGGG